MGRDTQYPGGVYVVRKLIIAVLILCVIWVLVCAVVYYSLTISEKPQPLRTVSSLNTELTILHLNVGQGDATLILGPETDNQRVSVLMDAGDIPNGGDKDGGAITASVLTQYAISQLDYFIASHYDADHIGGAISGTSSVHGTSFLFGVDGVLGTGDDISVRHFIDRGQEDEPDTRTYEKYEALTDSIGTRISLDTQEEVDDFHIDLGGGATMTLYASNGYVQDRARPVRYVNTENERSLCFLISYGDFDYLLGGDTIGRKAGSENAKVELAIAQALVDDGVDIEVYHVNHHGANNGSSAEFLQLIQPEVAIISVGNGNSHGHPHAETLQRLINAGVQRIYQTERGETEGELSETTDEKIFIVENHISLNVNDSNYLIENVSTPLP